ncbi:PocR ligand-binding domain-containing protein [Carboxylicivirga caseinilyticus]|uniref:PocR ligand-binding domain-containing protein n=1 Tax=Carboxylicivirga caseinilyticus TaxID=3417572 RepID=UPI003D33B438|nr:PocR ligand-binding domain-containing protein [Marinilabiliaceae bacterium A049]
MQYDLKKIIDVEKVEKLLETYTKATGLVSALLDLEGNILSKSGWQSICVNFHRINSDTAKNCKISDTLLANQIREGGEYNVYKCLNGLIDVAVPILVDGQHVGNLFTGQFFFESPDITFFNKQSKKYGFNEESYLNALSKVPVLSEEDVKIKLEFLSEMTIVIAELGLSKLHEEETKKQLQVSEEKYRKLFENINEGFALCEIITNEKGRAYDYRYLEVNLAFEMITGFKASELINRKYTDLFFGKEQSEWMMKFGESLLIGKDVSFEEYSSDLNCWIQVNAFSPKKGQFAVTLQDITDRKEAEKKLEESEKKIKQLNIDLEARIKERTKQLEDLNNELKSFTYSVSHDLKAPLRGINGYGKLLQTVYSSSLNEEAQIFIKNICQGAEQMNELIDDLLNYSRLERIPINISHINIVELINNEISLYKDVIANKKIIVEINVLKSYINTDAHSLTIAIRNLIGNAIKFTKDRSNPMIRIELNENEMSDILSIKDNGIGIDMKFKNKIFEIFQRLHRAEDYEGNGVGLALVKKAMQRIGGEVTFKSVLGEGTTFYMKIPK